MASFVFKRYPFSMNAYLLPALGGLTVAALIAAVFLHRWWRAYVESRETLYQPLILMAIANEAGGKLGPPFEGGRRTGDYTLVGNALFKWSKDLGGFAHKGFCRIFDLNGFGEAERERLASPFPGTRADAAKRLGQMNYMKAIPDLLPMLEDGNAQVRQMASWALAQLGQSDSTGMAITSSRPEVVEEAAGQSLGFISGRFQWEDGTPIVIGDKEETEYLVFRKGGMHGDVRNMPVRLGSGREIKGGKWQTYRSEYRLTGVVPTRPAVVKAVLKQAVDTYYTVTHRQRENIYVRAGSLTKDIDFVFPRFAGPDDRVSLMGRLIYDGRIQPGYQQGYTGGRPKAVVSLRGENTSFFSGYLSFNDLVSYRLHDIPPGRYMVKAVVAVFTFEGMVEVPQTQPHVLDLRLERATLP